VLVTSRSTTVDHFCVHHVRVFWCFARYTSVHVYMICCSALLGWLTKCDDIHKWEGSTKSSNPKSTLLLHYIYTYDLCVSWHRELLPCKCNRVVVPYNIHPCRTSPQPKLHSWTVRLSPTVPP